MLVTDIKMPYMDGMELSNRVKTEFPATKILLFTGFDEFEYAKEAIHLEVEEYILKPVNSAELKEVFSHLKIKLDQEISEKRNVEILKKYYLESLPLLRADFYTGLIEGRVHEDEISKYLSDCQLSFPGPFFCCLVIHISSSQEAGTIDPLLLAASVREHAKERLGKKWQAKSFAYLGNTVLILQLGSEHEVWELTDECDRFCRYARRMLGAVVTVGIGQICGHILELPQSYSSAREAVSYRAVYGASRAINMKEIVPQKMERPAASFCTYSTAPVTRDSVELLRTRINCSRKERLTSNSQFFNASGSMSIRLPYSLPISSASSPIAMLLLAENRSSMLSSSIRSI